ncbi:CatB-related O-acetyltransferase [Methylophaga sp. OBS4]|uniref:CatB-related O-acetyltransferase n=1 Tax=Methylophaga sp. OBS4 TaxID=2991935 RepID=UPI00225B3B61|nr:CatB-related O-acetyltransferase [Methylophaga sp. OBS4]MCX4187624.1 CatB-related O-acetyltransferase [Methylophaga sp. OBS4]
MLNLYELYQRIKAKKLGIKLSNIRHFGRGSLLCLEAPCRLSDIVVDLAFSEHDRVQIGAYSYIRSGSQILSVASIGRFCSIGRNVTLGLNPRNHPVSWVSTNSQFSQNYSRKIKPLEIGHDVWIGHNAVIMAGITIGHGAVIGCDAVVTRNVAPYEIFAGNPAKKIRLRFPEDIVEQLLSTQWWEYEFSELKAIDFEDVDNFANNAAKLSRKAHYKTVFINDRTVSTELKLP